VAVIEHLGGDELDPNDLPPTSAGILAQKRKVSYSCEGVISGVSTDGAKYVRESGGGKIYAASVNGEIAFYELDRYDYMVKVDTSRLDPKMIGQLKYSLSNCKGFFLPSGVRFIKPGS